MLPSQSGGNLAAVSRFQREMRAGGPVDHPHIVRAMDAGEIGGTHFLVMELVEGLDLAALVRKQGPLPVADACELSRPAALGLASAPTHGLIHRDIKPSNLFLTHWGSSSCWTSAWPCFLKTSRPARRTARPAAS